ncbi:hypothetical protein GCM10010182_42300 [Actinomadura cremea]|nr:hypothetical protein GCM10010182_42300 [Actinomadura cremea]
MRSHSPHADEAAAHLMSVAFMQIRTMAGRRKPSGFPEPVDSEDFAWHIRALADACSPLPGTLHRGTVRQRRREAAARLEDLWVVAQPDVLEWARFHLDKIGYDYARLETVRTETHAVLRAEGHIP